VAFTWQDLVVYTGSVYGLSWLVTRSKLFAPVRERLRPVPFVGHLIQCIVCTSVWVAAGVLLTLPMSSVFSPGFRVAGPVDFILLLGWTMAASWAIGKLLGDAE
jgi:hypothetical protein